jgi:hypothetical protein
MAINDVNTISPVESSQNIIIPQKINYLTPNEIITTALQKKGL